MNAIDRAMRAYNAMTVEQQKKMLPYLIGFAERYPRKPLLRLVVNNK
jgi:hypothetical protein